MLDCTSPRASSEVGSTQTGPEVGSTKCGVAEALLYRSRGPPEVRRSQSGLAELLDMSLHEAQLIQTKEDHLPLPVASIDGLAVAMDHC